MILDLKAAPRINSTPGHFRKFIEIGTVAKYFERTRINLVLMTFFLGVAAVVAVYHTIFFIL